MTPGILVTGSSGLVGSRFVELFPHPELLLTPSETEFDLLNPKLIKDYLKSHPVSAVVNFAAFTDVSAAENQREDTSALCWQLNVQGVKNLVSIVAPDVHFVQISTDMVFSGSSLDPGPYPENHPPQADLHQVTWYGYSKYQGELATGPSAAIVRISYPVRAKFTAKLDFFRKVLSLYDRSSLYPLFSDQQITISFIDEVAQSIQIILRDRLQGIFHVSSSDVGSPFTAASSLLTAARRVNGVVSSSSITTMKNPVRYPQFGGLLCDQTQKILGLKFSSISEVINQLVSQGLTV